MSSHRLPRHVLPRRYDLNLRPDLSDHVFSGTVSIEVDVVDPVVALVLNAAELSIHSATWTDAGGTAGCVVDLDDDLEQVRLTPPGQVASGRGRLDLAFTGVLNDRLCGFYRSTLLDPDGTTHAIATTQFQATDARRCFPCFDEPDMKAVFGVTLDVPDGLFAASNGAEASRTPLGDGHDRVQFVDTIPLSTYLVAFVVGPLEATDPVDVDGVPVRIIHPPGRADQTAFALEVAAHSLRWLARWYDIAVPGGKVDLVALPDFAFGAMENLGCITFREVLLLVDPESADQRELESVAAVISHELAHLWFGDLVTMRWWNGIWLNEAFATFMEMKAVEAWRPDWNVWAGFGSARAAALDVDALASTRPIEYPVVTPADAESMFDLLTYQKGAAVVRMLEQFLGEAVFRDGVRRYLSAHLGGNTDNEDLWTALEEASGEPVGDLMHAWIFRGGFPIVEGTVEGDSCTLVQSRFRYDGVEEDDRWQVPVRLRTTVGEQRVLLGDSPVVLDLEGPLVTLNAGADGFYRSEVDVSPDPGRLTAVERAMYVDDRWAGTLGGRHDPGSFAGFAEAFVDDPDLAVWQAVLRGFYTMDLVAPGRHLMLAAEAAGLLEGMVQRLGWEPSDDEDDRTRQLRGVLLAAAGTLADDPDIIGQARHRWASGTSTDPAVDGAVVTIVASHGDSSDRAECRRRFDASETSQGQQRHLRALALFPGLTEVETLLEEVNRGTIRTQDAPFLIRSLLAHPHQRILVWRNLVDHWEDLNGRLPSNSIARMLEGIRALGAEVDPDVDRFLDDNPVPQGALMVAQHRERRHVNLRLARRLDPT